MGQLVSLASRSWMSSEFDALFREGATLVEEVAAYLEGPGRRASKKLPDVHLAAYCTQSMHMTTVLMQTMAWLLLVRSVKEYEITEEQFKSDAKALLMRDRLRNVVALHIDSMSELPTDLCAFASRTNDLVKAIQAADGVYFSERGALHEAQQAS